MPSLNFPSLAIPAGSTVLVTGVSGYVGSNIADALLQYGFKVRGTTRNPERDGWMVPFFEQKYGNGSFELAEVSDITAAGSFDDALKDTAGVIHVASVTNFGTDPNANHFISLVVDSTLNVLKSAAKTPSVKRFVLTSSYSAAAFPIPGRKDEITAESWAEEAIPLADKFPEGYDDADKALAIYAASKVKGEQALWKWVKEEKPAMQVNVVLPGGNFGNVVNVAKQGFPSTAGMAAAIFENMTEVIETFIHKYPPEWFVDVEDDARIHVAALTHPDVVGERIYATAAPFNWNDVLQVVRKICPEREFREDVPGLWSDEHTIEVASRAEGLLKEMGRPGFTTLEESLRIMIGSVSSA